MVAALVQSKSAAVNTGSASNVVTWDTPAAAGSLLLVVVASDDYRTAGGVPSGFTESAGCAQQGNHGLYVWWKVAAGGETISTYTIASASTSVWETYEFSGIAAAPYDISAGQVVNSGAATYTTPTITSTAGERLLVGVIGGSTSSGNFTGMSDWLNSFVGQLVVGNTKASGTRDVVGLATRAVTANGATGYSTGATYSPNATGRTGIIVSFKVASGGGGQTVAPDGVAVAAVAGSPSVDGSLSVGPDGVSLPVSVGAPVVGAAGVNPDGLSVPVVVGVPALAWSAAVAPDGLPAAVALGAPVVGAAGLAPDGLAVPVVVGAPSLAWSGLASPDGVSVPAVVGAVSVSMPGTVVVRPFAGTVARPAAGVVVRPDAGVVSRP